MTPNLWIRVFLSVILSLMIAWGFFSKYTEEAEEYRPDVNQPQKVRPYFSGLLLPATLCTLVVLCIFRYGFRTTVKMLLSVCFSLFLQISIYYIALLFVLPFFRKHISARACALLWIIPNFLYVTIQPSFLNLLTPHFIFRVPKGLIWLLFSLWLAGFIGVFLWKIIEHFSFRRSILKDASIVSDVEICAVRDALIHEMRIHNPKFKLMFSPKIAVPLSVGLFARSTCILLPERTYTKEEITLILRHEMVHIMREDAWNKFFLVFCTAMCWFNPLMWIAMKKSAEDFELSCDETVLLTSGSAERTQYASLLLAHAGDERGFTTCLSASARSLQYRLKSIIKPAKRRSGIFTVSLIMFLLFMTGGYTAIAYGEESGAEIIYQNDDYSAYRLRSVSVGKHISSMQLSAEEEAAFHNRLAGLTLCEVSGNYTFYESDRCYHFILETPAGTIAVSLYDDMLKITKLYGSEPRTSLYYAADGIDLLLEQLPLIGF